MVFWCDSLVSYSAAIFHHIQPDKHVHQIKAKQKQSRKVSAAKTIFDETGSMKAKSLEENSNQDYCGWSETALKPSGKTNTWVQFAFTLSD